MRQEAVDACIGSHIENVVRLTAERQPHRSTHTFQPFSIPPQ
jgi:hypothetical protein